MRIFILYVALGYAVLSGVIFIHILKAEFDGYEACDWWDQFIPTIVETFSENELLIWFCVITITWPVRVRQLRDELADLRELYRLKHGKRRVSH